MRIHVKETPKIGGIISLRGPLVPVDRSLRRADARRIDEQARIFGTARISTPRQAQTG
jgi:hypothetical protein